MSEQVNNSKSQAGATAREVCIHIARELSTLVKHTLGPNGLDNMLVDTAGDSVITNDGATIIKQSAIDHAVAKVIMQVAKTQEEQCYDGTTSSLVLTGEMMELAAGLLKNKVPPNQDCARFPDCSTKGRGVPPRHGSRSRRRDAQPCCADCL
jgi:chaperonin GroEL (HSP60 family)